MLSPPGVFPEPLFAAEALAKYLAQTDYTPAPANVKARKASDQGK
jgi:hypothetical protein